MQYKHRLALIIAGGWLIVSATVSADYRKVYGSKHDLGTFAESGNSQSVCVYCHTKHSRQGGSPMWERISDSSFPIYSSSVAENSNSHIGITTAICLSCHDGTIGSDVRKGPTRTLVDDSNQWSLNNVAFNTVSTGQDHPVGVEIPTHLSGYRDIGSISAAGLELFDNRVECATCHAVHGGFGSEGFLRLDPVNADLCLGCHLK